MFTFIKTFEKLVPTTENTITVILNSERIFAISVSNYFVTGVHVCSLVGVITDVKVVYY